MAENLVSVGRLPRQPNKLLKAQSDDDVTLLDIDNVGESSVYRIGCLADLGNGFLHALIKSFSGIYNRRGQDSRQSHALRLRLGSTASFAADYDRLGHGAYRLFAQSGKPDQRLPDPTNEDGFSLQLSGIVEHLLGDRVLSPYIYPYFCRILTLGLLIVRVEGRKLKLLWQVQDGDYYAILLPVDGSWSRFELVARTDRRRLQTLYVVGDPLVTSLLEQLET